MLHDSSKDAADAHALVHRIRGGDRSAEARMYESYARPLRFLARRRLATPSDAEDVVQECFRIAIQRLRHDGLDDPAALPAFLRGIVLKLCLSWHRGDWREEAAEAPALADIPAPAHAAPLERLSSTQLQALVRRLIGEMTVARDRELLWGRYVKDQDKRVLCDQLGLSVEHYDRVLHRAHTRFRELALAADLGPSDASDP